MMNLQDRLDAISNEPSLEVTPEMEAVIDAAVENLRRSGASERVIKVGAIAPDFVLQDIDGRSVALAELRDQGPVVISFYRGVWCPYCNEDLKAMQEVLSLIERAGARLVAISPQKPIHSRRAARDLSLTFPLLWDEGCTIAEAFGLRFRFPADLQRVYVTLGVDLERINGAAGWTLPMPGRFVVERNGSVSYAESDPDYTRRPDPDRVVAHLNRKAAST